MAHFVCYFSFRDLSLVEYLENIQHPPSIFLTAALPRAHGILAIIGVRQYNLTKPPSLSLVGVLGLYHGPRVITPNTASTARIDQPTEIFDAILLRIYAPWDLPNIRLVCTRLHDVMFARHVEYRAIRSKESAIAVWNHSKLHCTLSVNVHRV